MDLKNQSKIQIRRELGEHDAEIGIYQEPDGGIVFTLSQTDNADKSSLAAQIAKAMICIAADDNMIDAINTSTLNKLKLTSKQSTTIH